MPADVYQHVDGLYVCFIGREGGWCVIVGTLQGKEGEAQELEQLHFLYTSYNPVCTVSKLLSMQHPT